MLTAHFLIECLAGAAMRLQGVFDAHKEALAALFLLLGGALLLLGAAGAALHFYAVRRWKRPGVLGRGSGGCVLSIRVHGLDLNGDLHAVASSRA